MPGRTLQADAAALEEKIIAHLPRILDQAQNTTANHQKNLVALYKLQAEAALCTEPVNKGRRVKLVGERIFEDTLFKYLKPVLEAKKGLTQADRVVKFLGQYIKFVNEKAAEEKNAEEEEGDDDTTASRFTARFLRFLFKGFLAKEKAVRYRVLQSVAEMVSHLGEVDEDIYAELRSSLMDRTSDKESSIRVQAVISLSKLSGAEDPSEVTDGGPLVLDVLLDLLAHDSSPDVRRAILVNVPITQATIPEILARTRDTDTTIRKLVYSTVLESNVIIRDDVIGPTHPRAFTISQRELIIRNGLGDRELSVRNAAASLLARWVEAIQEKPVKEETEACGSDAKIESGLVELLKMLDLAENTVATDAALSVLVTRPDIFENMEFGNNYWGNLTPETAFLARVFVEHGKATKDDTRLEAALPVVTELAFRIQAAYNKLVEDIFAERDQRLLGSLTDDDIQKFEDARLEQESVIGELLRMAVNLDYSDEIGRRKMFQLVRDMLSREELPESLLSKCLDVLRELSAGERDLIRVVVEIIHDLRDPGDDDDEEDPTRDPDSEAAYGETPATQRPPRTKKPPKEKTSEEKARVDKIDLRCLSLCIGMLERVNSTLEENSTLDGILAELIIPSVTRKELAFREKGILSLGLCSLIAKRLAVRSLPFFVNHLKKEDTPDSLLISLLKVIFDLLMVHDQVLRKEKADEFDRIIPYILGILAETRCDQVRAVICIGVSKLVLAGMITDDTVLINLVQIYLSPATKDNQELRQCLTFFFPVFCYSSPANQTMMKDIFLRAYKELKKDRKALGEDGEMLNAAQVTMLFLDWTDPTKLRNALDSRGKVDPKHQGNMSIQVDMAIDIMKDLLKDEELEKEDKKVFCQLLGKLYMPDPVEDDKIKQLKVLLHGLRSRRPLRDATTRNAFTKFEAAILKKYEKQLEDFSEEEYRKLEQLEALFEFLDEIVPEDDEEFIDLDEPKKKGRKRRSDSIATTTTENEEPASATSSKRGGSKPRSKRARLSKSDDDSDGEGTEIETPQPSSAPTRTLPKRSAATKKPPPVIEVSSGSDEDPTPPSRSKQSKQRKSTPEVKEEEQLDTEINELLDEGDTSEIPFDSIIDDTHDEDEEEEVNDLLVAD
ncbi:hypothetical protein H0H81_012436 [Sphagnurus paluster]|uniref:Nuclear condensin complex subunit 3 C-terminal domain-containing protein n=1 Tax=Sphagnurus paluster TaxID=117069 RepID=A0A9P7FTZ8_9AGAR|nr:hypothetical protein H0H81_012436 [Sphagnurus paluster]